MTRICASSADAGRVTLTIEYNGQTARIELPDEPLSGRGASKAEAYRLSLHDLLDALTDWEDSSGIIETATP
jgi:hypothetical protein